MPSAEYLKSELNVLYGKEMNGYWQPTLLKENKNMNRAYIVVHPHLSSNRAAIVIKDKISAIIPIDDNGYQTEIRLNEFVLYVKDSYEDVVKQMLK